MKNRIVLLLFSLLWGNVLTAQYETAVYDDALNHFNGGQALPSSHALMMVIDIPTRTTWLEVALFKAKSDHNEEAMYRCSWKRTDSAAQTAKLIFAYPLHANHHYDFTITYFRATSQKEKADLLDLLLQSVDTYLNHHIQQNGQKVDVGRRSATMIADLDELITQAMTHYRVETPFRGFSPVVGAALQTLRGYKQPSADSGSLDLRARLDQQIQHELEILVATDLLVQADLRILRDYPTAKTEAALALHAGYGGTYIEGNLDELAYGQGVYVGVSYALGRRLFRHDAWRPFSLSAGVFANNFSDVQGNTLTGPLLGRPYYMGMGYGVFRFIRIDLGGVALQARATPGAGEEPVNIGGLQVKPFIGLGAQVNIKAKLIKKKRVKTN